VGSPPLKGTLTPQVAGVIMPAAAAEPLATALLRQTRYIPQPLLFLQGDRDHQFPDADHLFLDGGGPATPLDYQKPGRVDPAVIATIASWIGRVDAG
jgi:hypothetical protein